MSAGSARMGSGATAAMPRAACAARSEGSRAAQRSPLHPVRPMLSVQHALHTHMFIDVRNEFGVQMCARTGTALRWPAKEDLDDHPWWS